MFKVLKVDNLAKWKVNSRSNDLDDLIDDSIICNN